MNKPWWVVAGLLLAISVALVLRCPRLDARPMHNDEGVNALKFRDLWEHGSFKYDPKEYHGPALYYATVAISRLSGAPDFNHFSERRFRAVTILFGVALIILLPLLLDALGTKSLLWAAAFTAVSPAMVFYSRYYIHEMLLVFFAFLALSCGWRYWRSRKPGWAMLTGAAVGLMFATKETFVLSVIAAVLALGLNQLWNRFLDASFEPHKTQRFVWWHLAAAAGVGALVIITLFSSLFTNWRGVLDAFLAFVVYRARPTDSAHFHGPFFYLHRLLFFHQPHGPIWSEGLILVLALVGTAAAFARKGLVHANPGFVRFLAFYAFGLLLIYSLLSYKTPWCLLNFWQPMLLLAGVGAAVLVRLAKYQWARVTASVVLLAGAMQLGGQAWQASTAYAATSQNPYVYAQTSGDALKLVEKVRELSCYDSPESTVRNEGEFGHGD